MTVPRQPDVLLLVLDTLRADRLSGYGYPRETTPHIDAFAEDSVLFERAISPAQWTIPAHASFFTGEYPTTHRTAQIYDKHSEDQTTLAEVLRREGYQTVGFCINTLLGVVDNGLDRGFEEFYNYGGALPNRPGAGDTRSRLVGRLMRNLTIVLRQIVTPAQDVFARSDLLLRLALHPRIVPIWRRYVNFKGNTVQSVRDLVAYLRTRRHKGADRPLFAFVNLMETHLPFGPRPRFIRKFASWYRQDREARDFMQCYNHEHYRWMVPLKEPLTEMQDRAINDLYDAEVGYEDHLLRGLFSYLDEPDVRDNTLVFVTSDHGEGLNHHDFVGHSLVAYDDLVHVPLIVRYPRLYPEGIHVSHPVSTRRIFHSALEAAGVREVHSVPGDRAPIDVRMLSLRSALDSSDPEWGQVWTEAPTPDTLIALMRKDDGDAPDELFDVVHDPGEEHNLLKERREFAGELYALLGHLVQEAKARASADWKGARLQLEGDRQLAARLRGLGYLE
jgi:uncharacterized sulfatase